MKHIYFFFPIIVGTFLFSSTFYGQLNPSFFEYTEKKESFDLIDEFPEYNAFINWTTGELVTEYSIPITYTDPNIGRNTANFIEKLKEKLIFFTLGVLTKVRVTSSFLVGNFFNRHEETRFQILSTLYSLPIQNSVVKNARMYGSISFPLYGINSISEEFYKNIRSTRITNFLKKETIGTQVYDTLIIDTVMFPQFEASLMPRILDQQGTEIHSINTVDPQTLRRQGPVHYVTSITEAFNLPVRGNKVAYILPKSLEGTTDLILFDSDIQRIYAQMRTVDQLRQGRVIIIKPQDSITNTL